VAQADSLRLEFLNFARSRIGHVERAFKPAMPAFMRAFLVAQAFLPAGLVEQATGRGGRDRGFYLTLRHLLDQPKWSNGARFLALIKRRFSRSPFRP